MSDGKIDFTSPGFVRNHLDRRVLRNLLRADVDGFNRQLAGFRSAMATLKAQIETVEAYKQASEQKLAALGDDDDPE
jgi:hypothetical protein